MDRLRQRCALGIPRPLLPRYVDTTRWMLGIRTSDDGGQTWSKPVRLQPGVTGRGAVFSGPIPVTRPNGGLVVPYSFFAPLNEGGRGVSEEDRVAAVVSHDGGATFTQPIRIAALEAADDLTGIRARRCRPPRSMRLGRRTSPGRTGASGAARAKPMSSSRPRRTGRTGRRLCASGCQARARTSCLRSPSIRQPPARRHMLLWRTTPFTCHLAVRRSCPAVTRRSMHGSSSPRTPAGRGEHRGS